MKKHGILNRELAGIFAKIGHTDTIVIADCGLPIPDGVPCIDLAYTLGKPSFADILEVVLDDFKAEKAVIAQEMEGQNTALHSLVQQVLYVPIETVSHEELKELSSKAKVIIRTGEATPFANIILQSGVIF
ncbi:D-ribose pyranase [Rummeliibacillus sp. NPDC094406]|uniref:D-ribose pyranase n=1 Tax=Rummeliibacillus sp. NPDC094406 TaxID=3364511 RepID=UPI00380FB7D9